MARSGAGCRLLALSPLPSLSAGAVINGRAARLSRPSARVGVGWMRLSGWPPALTPGPQPARSMGSVLGRRLGRRDKMGRWAPADCPLRHPPSQPRHAVNSA